VLVTPGSTAVREHDRIGDAEFATDPCASLFGRFFTRFRREPSGNANVNVARVGDRMVALTEPPMPVEFDPETLDTIGVAEYPDAVGGATSTAHPLTDSRTGDLINVVLAFGRRSEYRVTRQHGTLTREVIAVVPSDRPGYLHSFAVTERHVVIVVHPLVVNPLSFVLRGRPFIDNFRWNPAAGTRIVVIDTATGAIRVDTTTTASSAFHHINAFDLPRQPEAGRSRAWSRERGPRSWEACLIGRSRAGPGRPPSSRSAGVAGRSDAKWPRYGGGRAGAAAGNCPLGCAERGARPLRHRPARPRSPRTSLQLGAGAVVLPGLPPTPRRRGP
jgi:hypothetical protein